MMATALIVLALAEPATAQAFNPLDAIPSLDPVQWAVDGFKAILTYIFGDKINDLGKNIVNLLLAVPLLTNTRTFPQLNEFRGYIQGGAWGIVGLSFVISSMRFWLASYGGSGAYEGLMGFIKTSGAICIMLSFTIAFDQISRVTNAMTSAIVAAPMISSGLHDGLVGTVSTVPIAGGGPAMIIALIAIVMSLVLLLVKVVITALMAVLFVLSPLAIAVWPIEELGWALKTLVSALGALLVFPILWAICFGTFAVLNNDALFPGSHGDLINSILSPLIVLASLIIAFRLPFAVLSLAVGSGIMPSSRHGMMIARGVRSFGSGGGAAPASGGVSRGAYHSDTSRVALRRSGNHGQGRLF